MFGVLVAVWLNCLGMASLGYDSFLGGVASSLRLGCVITVGLWSGSLGCGALIGVWHVHGVASPLVSLLWSVVAVRVSHHRWCVVSPLGCVCGCVGLLRCSRCWFMTLSLQFGVTMGV